MTEPNKTYGVKADPSDAEFLSVKPYTDDTKASLFIAPHYRIELRYVPNWFHRTMMRAFFGFRVKVWA